jgi:hypothetical protein
MTGLETSLEANTMTVLASKNEVGQQPGTEAARRSAPTFLIVSFSILGVAVTYFGALYLITH